MICELCLASTRVFGVCVVCTPKPGNTVTDQTLRWFLDVLAEQSHHSLSDDHARLIRLAAQGELTAEHHLVRAANEADAAYAEATSPESTAKGRYVGTVKGRWEGPVRCERVVPLGPGQYGERFLIIFKTIETDGTEPATLTWFTGEGGKFGPEENCEYVIRTTVKEHKPYKGVRQTVITRTKEVENEDGE